MNFLFFVGLILLIIAVGWAAIGAAYLLPTSQIPYCLTLGAVGAILATVGLVHMILKG